MVTSVPGATISFPMFGEGFAIDPPSSFQVFGLSFTLYGVVIAFGFLLAIFYCNHYRKKFGLTSDDFFGMMCWAVPLAIIGARLYYCITYRDASGVNPYFLDPVSIIYIWHGGLAIYGGIIGGLLGVLIYSRTHKISFGAFADMGAYGLLIGQTIGRWGNFFNREAFGWTENIDKVFCRMGLTDSAGNTIYVHPTFLYESVWNLIGFILLHLFLKSDKRKYDGQIFAMYVLWYGFGRFFIEGLRTDSLPLAGTGIRISQLLAAITVIGAAVYLVVNAIRPHDPNKLFVNVRSTIETENIAQDGEE